MIAYRAFTHDLRPPVQGGPPVWNGNLPFDLPRVGVDTSDVECGAGWNACADAATVLRISGFWPDGRPSRLFSVETDAPVISRGDKLRAATWRVVRELSENEIADAIRSLSVTWFGDLAAEMTVEQLAWRHALSRSRPEQDATAVNANLEAALKARGLLWTTRRFANARDAWDAWDARGAWDARDARGAWDALIHNYAARRGWINAPPDKYRDSGPDGPSVCWRADWKCRCWAGGTP